MESLVKSLLGKDQEHVYETMQNMIADAEKVKNIEFELKEVQILLEKVKDENEQNKKKVSDLKDDLHYERGINEELVDELKEKDLENEHLKNCVKNRDDISNSLDDMFKEKMDEISNLRENCASLAKQVGRELILENKVEIQNKIIDTLKANLKEAEDTVRTGTKDNLEKLMSEIRQLEEENEAKVKQLADMQIGNEMMKERLQTLEAKNAELIINVQKVDDEIPLSEELSLACKLQTNFECEYYGKAFATKDDLRSHGRLEHEVNEKKLLEDKLFQLETQVSLQKLHLTEDLLELNVRESFEKKKCICKGKCNIIHKLYNWKRKYGQELHSQLLSIKEQGLKKDDEDFILKSFSCNPWGINFISESQLRKHLGTSR